MMLEGSAAETHILHIAALKTLKFQGSMKWNYSNYVQSD